MIPEFPNEANPGNPVTGIALRTQDGTVLCWTFDTPVQQSRMMLALGSLFARVSKAMPELSLPELEAWLNRPDRPSIVCLCGSTRFKEAFIFANYQLTMQGHIVLSVGWFSDNVEATHRLSPEDKTLVDALYMDKIALADEIFVLNVDGYIGESTANEIAEAKSLGKPVRYLVEVRQQEGGDENGAT